MNVFNFEIREEDLLILTATVVVIAAAGWMKEEADRCEESNEEVRLRLLRIEDQLTLANERIEQGNDLMKGGKVDFDHYRRR